ncbi:MAG TPA: 30S ribosomal protein S16 [Vicinamibacterales bacterium]|jgi:small subunit ribosomal protein S16|nr:30S ribosomal protein S16 [Vicinamibacterales bacterium]
MLTIRMRRAGAKNRPFFRVVVTEARSAREGRFVEVLGHYNPRTTPEAVEIDRDRLAHWLKAGAQPSDTVRTLIDRLPPVEAAAAPEAAAQ